MHVDNAGWSGEGAFTQIVLDRLRTIEQVAAVKVEDAPATRSEADYNFIANEIFVTFATSGAARADQEAGDLSWQRRRGHEKAMTFDGAREGAGRVRRASVRPTTPTRA